MNWTKLVTAVAALVLVAGLGVGNAEAATSKKQTVAAEKSQKAKKKYAAKRYCGNFFQCMFGERRTRTASVSSAGFWSGGKTRQIVDWNNGKYAPGSIIVRTPERKLYYVLPGGKAMRYSVGVGKEGFQWGGSSRIARKAVWPSWTPPKTMIERERKKGHYIPAFMEGGPGNPLGARALYIGGTLFRIHGTNNAASIGGAVSSGCIRMMNADIIDLYDRARVGARVYVYQ